MICSSESWLPSFGHLLPMCQSHLPIDKMVRKTLHWSRKLPESVSERLILQTFSASCLIFHEVAFDLCWSALSKLRVHLNLENRLTLVFSKTQSESRKPIWLGTGQTKILTYWAVLVILADEPTYVKTYGYQHLLRLSILMSPSRRRVWLTRIRYNIAKALWKHSVKVPLHGVTFNHLPTTESWD